MNEKVKSKARKGLKRASDCRSLGGEFEQISEFLVSPCLFFPPMPQGRTLRGSPRQLLHSTAAGPLPMAENKGGSTAAAAAANATTTCRVYSRGVQQLKKGPLTSPRGSRAGGLGRVTQRQRLADRARARRLTSACSSPHGRHSRPAAGQWAQWGLLPGQLKGGGPVGRGTVANGKPRAGRGC